RAAFRAALEARTVRRRRRERQVIAMPEPEAADGGNTWSDVRSMIDQELNHLPAKYRDAVVLCDLQGKSRGDAAQKLGVPGGTLSGRLTTARRMLAKRRARHGLTFSGAAVAAMLAENGAAARVPELLFVSAANLASRLMAGACISGKAAGIANGVLKTMLLHK